MDLSDQDRSYPANPSIRLSSPITENMHTLFTGNSDAYWPRAVAAAAAAPYASGLPANLSNCYSAAYDQVIQYQFFNYSTQKLVEKHNKIDLP